MVRNRVIAHLSTSISCSRNAGCQRAPYLALQGKVSRLPCLPLIEADWGLPLVPSAWHRRVLMPQTSQVYRASMPEIDMFAWKIAAYDGHQVAETNDQLTLVVDRYRIARRSPQ